MSVEKDFGKYLRAAEQQGWEVRPKKKGFMLVPADKTKNMVMVHRTPSDNRALNNILAEMRRSGFVWPWPPVKRGER